MMIKLQTPLTEETCRKLIDRQVAKDKREAEIMLKIINGKASELPALRRKLAGSAISQLIKYLADETHRTAMKASAEVMFSEGSERFVSLQSGTLLIEVPDAILTGAKVIPGQIKLGEHELKSRFKSKTLEYVKEEMN